MKTDEQVKETKNNGILYRVPVIGAGTEADPKRPDIFDKLPGAYFHTDWDSEKLGKVDVWVNKIKSTKKIVTDSKKLGYTKKKETGK